MYDHAGLFGNRYHVLAQRRSGHAGKESRVTATEVGIFHDTAVLGIMDGAAFQIDSAFPGAVVT
jgi:hypothetical protein